MISLNLMSEKGVSIVKMWVTLLALLVVAGPVGAAEMDKAKLRQLATERCAKMVTVSQVDFLNLGDRITSTASIGRFYKFGGGIVRLFLHYKPCNLNITAFQNLPIPKIDIAAGSQMPNISSPERTSAGKASQRFASFQTARIANPNASGQVMTFRL